MLKAALLVFAGGNACEFCAIEIRLLSKAADARQLVPLRFSRLNLIDTGSTEFTFKPDKLVLLSDRHLHIRLRKDRDHVTGLKREILRFVAGDGFAEIEREQTRGQVIKV